MLGEVFQMRSFVGWILLLFVCAMPSQAQSGGVNGPALVVLHHTRAKADAVADRLVSERNKTR